MKKLNFRWSSFQLSILGLLIISFLIIDSGCRKQNIDRKDLRDFQQVNLVSNSGAYSPALTDPTLLNAWGLAWSPTGIAWVNSLGGHVSELYTAEGSIVRPPVNIPSASDTIGGLPTGIVFAGGSGFKLSNGQPAAFLFVGVDGIVSGWNQAAGNNALRIADNSATSVYTGLALASWNGAHYLYATNFRQGKIDVWDTTFNTMNFSFLDPGIPAGFSPFNIQALGSFLYVQYAKPGMDGKEEKGEGLGYVDIFNPDGSFVKRFASKGPLNAPWGITISPVGFLNGSDMSDDSGDKNAYGSSSSRQSDPGTVILVGNFGDGKINVYDMEGEYLGQLHSHKNTIVIDGLWALSFAPVSATTIDPQRLYFTAGPKDENDGLFGYLIKK